MSLPYSDIETKVELAAVRHLNGIVTSRLAGITVHPGLDDADLHLPNVVCQATSAEEHIYNTGNYAVDLQLKVSSIISDTTPTVHRQRVAYVRDEFANDWVGASLSSQGVTDFTAIAVILEKSSRTIIDDHWTTTIPIVVHCRPS